MSECQNQLFSQVHISVMLYYCNLKQDQLHNYMYNFSTVSQIGSELQGGQKWSEIVRMIIYDNSDLVYDTLL